MIPASEPIEVCEQDGDDHARLDALAKEDDKRGEHIASN
jgi:hypothetical protein